MLEELSELLEDCYKYGHYLVSLCPFHSETRASFFVYEDYYRCASCDAHGKTSYLLAKLSNLPTKYQQERIYYPNPFTLWLKVCGTLGNCLRIAHNGIPSQYLLDRKIEIKTQDELSLGYMDDWYTFPIRSQKTGKIIGAVARKSPDNPHPSKYTVPKGQDPNLLYVPSWELVEKSRHIVLCFGIIDAISLYQIGIASMSTTTGKQLNPKALNDLRKQIWIIPDRGEEKNGNILAAQLGWRGHVLKMNWPEGCKDLNDVDIKYPDLLQQSFRQFITA